MKIIILLLVFGVVFGGENDSENDYDSDVESVGSTQDFLETKDLRKEGKELLEKDRQEFVSQVNLDMNLGKPGVIKPFLTPVIKFLEKSVYNNLNLFTDIEMMIENFKIVRTVKFDNLYLMSDSMINLMNDFEDKVEASKIIILKCIKWFEDRMKNVPRSVAWDSLDEINYDLEAANKHFNQILYFKRKYLEKVNEIPKSVNLQQTFLEVIGCLSKLKKQTLDRKLFDRVNDAIEKMELFEY